MATTHKAVQIAAELADILAKRTSLAVTQLNDKDGNPLIKVGTGVDGAAGCVIRIKPIAYPLATDILGLQSQVYTPHILQFVTEAAAANDLGLTNWSVLGPVLAESFKRGTRVEFYVTANNTGGNDNVADLVANAEAAQSTCVAATLKASVEYDIYQQMLTGQ